MMHRSPHKNEINFEPRPTWTLIGPDGRSFESPVPGSLGGHKRGKIYGRLDCRAARQAIIRGGYINHRIFFFDEMAAIIAGYRPCSVCCPEKYENWKIKNQEKIQQ